MRSNRAICVGGLVFASTCLAACGSGGSLLSAYQAHELKNQLAQVSQALSAHQCAQAANEITNFQSTVNGLGSVDSSLVSNLNQGASTIKQLAGTACPAIVHHVSTPTVSTPATTTSTQATTTTPTTPTITTPTTPTTTTPTTPTTTTPTGPGSGGAGLPGNGHGNGNGAGD